MAHGERVVPLMPPEVERAGKPRCVGAHACASMRIWLRTSQDLLWKLVQSCGADFVHGRESERIYHGTATDEQRITSR